MSSPQFSGPEQENWKDGKREEECLFLSILRDFDLPPFRLFVLFFVQEMDGKQSDYL